MMPALILGVLLLVAGLLGMAFRGRLDDANMRYTPHWMKPADGGGAFSPDQRSYRLKSAAVGMGILALTGLGLVIAAVVHG